jgi:UDP-glucose 4-epimerase
MTVTLVTGASGFVGSFLMEEMRRRNLPAKGVSRTAKKGLVHIPAYDDKVNWGPLLNGVDTVVHLAARVHVMNENAANPLTEFRKVNVDASLHLARAAVDAGVRRFVYLSTIKVNGEETQPGRPFKEEDCPAPQGPYAISKAEAESALLELGRNSGLEIVIIRPPMVYGPGVKGNMATLARWARFGLPSPFGAVCNKRSLIHVSNLCGAIIAACAHANAANQVFLVADSTSISTHEVLLDLGWRKAWHPLDAILSRTASAVLRLKRSARMKLLGNLEVDIQKARTQLQWNPSPFVNNRK